MMINDFELYVISTIPFAIYEINILIIEEIYIENINRSFREKLYHQAAITWPSILRFSDKELQKRMTLTFGWFIGIISIAEACYL